MPLIFRNEMKDGSIRSEILIGARNAPVLFHLSLPPRFARPRRMKVVGSAQNSTDWTDFLFSDGSNSPYSRTFEELPLAIRQLEPEDERSVAPLQVVYAGDTLVLRVGDRRQLRGDAQLEVFLSKSFYTRPGATPPLEGEPYVVELMIFRRN